jgi:hypothetical protein
MKKPCTHTQNFFWSVTHHQSPLVTHVYQSAKYTYKSIQQYNLYTHYWITSRPPDKTFITKGDLRSRTPKMARDEAAAMQGGGQVTAANAGQEVRRKGAMGEWGITSRRRRRRFLFLRFPPPPPLGRRRLPCAPATCVLLYNPLFVCIIIIMTFFSPFTTHRC